MLIRDFENLPVLMKSEQVKIYFEMLNEKRTALFFKRIFDIFFSFLLIIILGPVMLIIAFLIKLDSKGPVFYKQIRVTKNLKEFLIIKFRTMVENIENEGLLVTLSDDKRVTKIGSKIRKYRLDELPQLFNILCGDMSFVGTRPEVVKFVAKYSEEMMATLLLPGGLTSTASILFRNEADILKTEKDAEYVYLSDILPQKMVHNLEYLRDFNFVRDLKILFRTIFSVI